MTHHVRHIRPANEDVITGWREWLDGLPSRGDGENNQLRSISLLTRRYQMFMVGQDASSVMGGEKYAA